MLTHDLDHLRGQRQQIADEILHLLRTITAQTDLDPDTVWSCCLALMNEILLDPTGPSLSKPYLAVNTSELESFLHRSAVVDEWGIYFTEPESWSLLLAVISLIFQHAQWDHYDLLGHITMAFLWQCYEHPDWPHLIWESACHEASQYFYQVSPLEEISQALHRALEQCPADQTRLAQAIAILLCQPLTSLKQDWLARVFLPQIWPLLEPHYEPVLICDACVGTGTMLLAFAAHYPAYTVHLGLVRFCGADIDPFYPPLARLNCLLYGLNNYQIVDVGEATSEELQVHGGYEADLLNTYREAYQIGDHIEAAEISEYIEEGRQESLNQRLWDYQLAYPDRVQEVFDAEF